MGHIYRAIGAMDNVEKSTPNQSSLVRLSPRVMIKLLCDILDANGLIFIDQINNDESRVLVNVTSFVGSLFLLAPLQPMNRGIEQRM